ETDGVLAQDRIDPGTILEHEPTVLHAQCALERVVAAYGYRATAFLGQAARRGGPGQIGAHRTIPNRKATPRQRPGPTGNRSIPQGDGPYSAGEITKRECASDGHRTATQHIVRTRNQRA